MSRLLACLALVCLALAAGAAERLPADCRWVVQLDVPALLRTRAGAWLGQQLLRQPHAARLQVLEAVSGLQPERDLRLITLCGVDGNDDNGLILVRGTFDAARLEALAKAAAGHQAVRAGGRTIHLWADKGKPAAGCLAAPDLLLLGKSAQRIREALALLDDPARPSARIALPPAWDEAAVIFGAADRIDALVAGQPASATLGNLRACAARLVEQGDELVLEARAEAVGEAAAQQLVDAGRGLAAIVQLQRPAGLDAALAEALRAARLERRGATVELRLAVPTADVVRLVGQRAGL